MTDLEKAIELARKHDGLFGIRNLEECLVAACQEMAEWKEKEILDCAVDAYCECCDTKECEDCFSGECNWKLKFEKKLLKKLKKN